MCLRKKNNKKKEQSQKQSQKQQETKNQQGVNPNGGKPSQIVAAVPQQASENSKKNSKRKAVLQYVKRDHGDDTLEDVPSLMPEVELIHAKEDKVIQDEQLM